MGVITATLVALSAARVLTEKKLELCREASSGYNLNAFYLAVNITSGMETTILMVILAFTVIWLRSSVTSELCTVLNFVMLGWIASSWSVFFPLVIPPRLIVLLLTFFMVFFGVAFSGGMDPATFKGKY